MNAVSKRVGDHFPSPSPLAAHWAHDPGVCYLNHGSFGSCPRAVLEAQSRWRDAMEAEGVRFFVEQLRPRMDEARKRLADFVRCDWEGIAFLHNETTVVATVLDNIRFRPGDEILVTSQEYPACRNAVDRAAARTGARVAVAPIPWPVTSEDDVVTPILHAANQRTRLALISHVTSPTGLVLPIKRIVREMKARGVETLVDAAHGVGFMPIDLDDIGAAYYSSNLHKWLCTPKGAAFLHVRRDLRDGFRPLVLSNNATIPIQGRSQFLTEFDFIGTDDYTAFLVIPEAIEFMDRLLPGGWPEVMLRNRDLSFAARDLLCQSLGTPPPAPDSMVGPLASVLLPPLDPESRARLDRTPTRFSDPLQDRLVDKWRIQVPVIRVGQHRHVRVSAQLYNSIDQYRYLAHALSVELAGP